MELVTQPASLLCHTFPSRSSQDIAFGGEKMEFETIVSIAGAVSLTVELMRLVQWLDRPRRGNGKDSV